LTEALTAAVSVLGTLGATHLRNSRTPIAATPEQVNELIIETQRLEAAVHRLVELLEPDSIKQSAEAIAAALDPENGDAAPKAPQP
jgi:hypothetical protein